jgi:hypothetical protein
VTLTRLETEPTSPDEVRAAYGGIDLAPLAAGEGFRTAVLFVDPQSGHGVAETIWRDVPAMVAARGVAAERRLQATSARAVTVRGIEHYRLDFHSVELE